MRITELIERLESIKNIGGDLECLFFERNSIHCITQSDVIAVTNNSSYSLRDAVYFRTGDPIDSNEIEVDDEPNHSPIL